MIGVVSDKSAVKRYVVRQCHAISLLMDKGMGYLPGIIMLVLNTDNVELAVLVDKYFRNSICQEFLWR